MTLFWLLTYAMLNVAAGYFWGRWTERARWIAVNSPDATPCVAGPSTQQSCVACLSPHVETIRACRDCGQSQPRAAR